MDNWQDLVWETLFGLVIIFFGGWIIGGALNLVAMASPQMVSIIFCPDGSTGAWGPAPGQNGSAVSCKDENGTLVPTLTDAESVALQRKYFYKPGTIITIVLVAGWIIRRRMRNRVR